MEADYLTNPSNYMVLIIETINTMLRGGASHATILNVIYIINKNYNGVYNKEQLEEEILTAHEIILENGGYKSRRNVQQEVENLVQFRGKGIITLNDFYTDLKLNDKEEKAACRVAINRMVANDKIEKVDSGRTGTYRLIQSGAEETKFIKGPRGHFPIKLPFGLNKLCYIHPKSIIILAGSKSAGKTATLLHTALENQNDVPIDYFNSDMGDEEYTDRMQKMGVTCEEDIRFRVFNRSSDFHDLVTPEKKIFIVDFLEIHENFFEIGKPIKQIWERLKEGIAIIAIQMKTGGTLARGGDFTKEKARLYLSMDFLQDEKCTRIKIVDAKAPTAEFADGVCGWERKVKIINGSMFTYLSNWNNYEAAAKEAQVRGKF